ncbi:pre-mRNA-splicing factor prp46 [Entomophthora muscae]|uniref:Pre-mRNA-splicing factor prp46 n=1 Tax=Entomophthora muscae TaxID=34485 RepID=A0ACC2RNR5_9FUNG|nr:pre-mRNA-splicing factor prp46 [Entomophthora muscae]
MSVADIPPPEVLLEKSVKRTNSLFVPGSLVQEVTGDEVPPSQRIKLSSKIRAEYQAVRELPKSLTVNQTKNLSLEEAEATQKRSSHSVLDKLPINQKNENGNPLSGILTIRTASASLSGPFKDDIGDGGALIRRKNVDRIKPEIACPLEADAGHKWASWLGSFSCCRSRKPVIWDLASGTLKLSLTGHISSVRGLEVSPRHPYLFSCGEDKMVKCWDLEQNKVIRHYHGHLSGVYSLSLHPTLDLLVTSGRDSTARVWDMRTKQCVHVLGGHRSTVGAVRCQEADPQVITSSMDSTIRLWDLAAGRTLTTLTHHKKSVRALALHPKEFSFASGSPDNIKQFRCPEGNFVQNYSGHDSIIDTLAINADNVMVSGANNGTLKFWDWKSGHNFQSMDSLAQPGSLDSEAGIFCSTFDRSGLRLITGEADKTIKVWKEDETATPESHPIDWKPNMSRDRY